MGKLKNHGLLSPNRKLELNCRHLYKRNKLLIYSNSYIAQNTSGCASKCTALRRSIVIKLVLWSSIMELDFSHLHNYAD